jgi:cation diffusion facilitator CzcD-associated flavoprotein CzcO
MPRSYRIDVTVPGDMLSAVIVGAGFSGLCAGIALRRAGIFDFVIVEKEHGIGGTWRDNTYPGAACDIPSHLYSYSFEPNPRWQRRYGGQAEILAYLEHCATKYELRSHLRLDTRVTRARYDERTASWRVDTTAGALVARAVIMANGALHEPAIPKLSGANTFAGVAFHSARWRHDVALADKRIAVVGTGASAIQFVPELAKQARKLTVFQRTPPWIVPKEDRAIEGRERWVLEHVPGAHWLRRTGLYWMFESRVLAFVFSQRLSRLLERLVRKYLAESVPDPVLRQRLTPNYRLGCKRILISNDYYPALQRANVELVTEPIERVEPAGIRTASGRLHEVDALIYGTGFRVTEYMSAIETRGLGGAELGAEWSRDVRNYLGINVSGFPNLFIMFGPNTGLGHNSMIFMIEAQAHYIIDAILRMNRNAVAAIDVRPDVERTFRAELSRRLATTVWSSGCNSWYQGPDGEPLLWPSFTFDYWWRTRRVDLNEYTTISRADVAS